MILAKGENYFTFVYVPKEYFFTFAKATNFLTALHISKLVLFH